MSYTGFFLDTPYKVVDGNIVYASDLNNPLAAITTGFSNLVDAVQTGATIAAGVDVGTVNAYQISLVAAPASYVDGLMVWFKPAATNTGAATLNVNSLGAKPVRSSVRSALVGGELLAGFWFQLKYSSSHDVFLMVSYHGGTDISALKAVSGGEGITVTSNDDTVFIEVTDDGVTTDKILDDAVTTDKIADGAVTGEKISDAANIVRLDVTGGDVTVSSNDLIIAACECWDTTGTVWLESVGATLTIPSTNNLDSYVFLTRLVSGGTFALKLYTAASGAGSPDADATVNAWSPVITYAKNNGAGVTMPYVQKADRVDWITSTNRPVLTASITASYESYNLGGVLPVVQFKEVTLAQSTSGSSANQFNGSYDGSTDITSGVVHLLSILAVTSIYLKSGTSSAIHLSSATLRR